MRGNKKKRIEENDRHKHGNQAFVQVPGQLDSTNDSRGDLPHSTVVGAGKIGRKKKRKKEGRALFF